MSQQQRGGENVLNDSSYTFYFDTASRVTAGDTQNNDPTNLTNPAVMQVNLSRPKAPYSQLYLASLELPKLAQYTVETEWQNLYFSEGIQLRAVEANARPASVREFSVRVNETVYTAYLPLYLNPIISVAESGTTTPVLTFQYEHGLEGILNNPAACPALDDPIRIIATNVPYVESLATEFLILDTFSVQLNLSAPVTWVGTSPAGYLYCPAIPSPTQLACMITAALDVVSPTPGEFRVTYDPVNTGLFTFCVAKPSLSTNCRSNIPIPACQAPPPIQSCNGAGVINYKGYNVLACATSPANTNEDDVSLYIDSSICLVVLLGFGKSNNNGAPTQVRVPGTAPYCVTGQYGFCACESVVAIPPGNYDASTLGNVLSTQLNRFYFPCGCGNVAPTVRNFVFSDQCGTCYAITIPCGLYCADTFAAFLEEQMNAADTGKSYTVTYTPATGFCISAAQGNQFALEFGDSTAMEVAYRMGFPTISLRGRSTYCSCQVPVIPQKDCCIDPRCLSQVYEVIYNANTPQFCIIPSVPKPITATLIVCDAGPATTATVTGAYAHGLSAGDVVRLSVSTVGTIEAVVVSIVDAFEFVIELGSVDCAATFTDNTTCYQNAQFPALNLFLAPANCQINPIKPIFLGFLPQDKLYIMGESDSSLCCTTSTALVNLDLTPYLLLVAEFPSNLFTGNSHTSPDQQTMTQILAKIILYPNFRLERIMNFNGFIQGLENVSQIKLVLLTPDHKPYKMHNINWSGTLVFLVPQGVVKLTQY